MLGIGFEQIANVITRFESRNIHADPLQCSRLRHKNSSCRRCVDSCPVHAITWTRTLTINPDTCDGCGICAAVCPTGALEAASPTNAELLNSIEQRKETACLAFACPKAAIQSDDRVIEVPCLGRLDESLLVSAASYGIEKIQLVDGLCADCPNGVGRTVAARAVAESNALLRAFSTAPRIYFAAQLLPTPTARGGAAPSGQVLSRRAFFTRLTRETKAAAALTVSIVLNAPIGTKNEIKKGELPRRVPIKRQSLLAACRRLGKDTLANVEIRGGEWATCHIKENCTGCRMCAFFCPTGALSRAEQDGEPALAFRVAECTDCHLCQDICFWNALEFSDDVDLTQVMENASVTLTFPFAARAREAPDAKLERLIQSIH